MIHLGILNKLQLFYTKFCLIKFIIISFLLGFETALLRLKHFNKNALKDVLLHYGAKIGINCDIESGLTFHNCKDFNNFIVGDNCHIGKNCFFDLRDKITIGENVVISMNCTFITHIDLNNSSLRMKYPKSIHPIQIKDDVYIGACSLVLMNTVINHRSIIAAHSLVNKDILPDCIYGGIPAKKIKDLVL